MNRIARCMMVAITLLVVATASNDAAQAFCIWGFGKCETSNLIAGEYVLDGNPNATLTITPDRITSKTGPVSFSVDYTVKSTEGKNVTIEVKSARTQRDLANRSREGLHQDPQQAPLRRRLEEEDRQSMKSGGEEG